MQSSDVLKVDTRIFFSLQSQPVWPLETLESLPGTPEPSSPCSMLPQSETDDGGPRSVSRASVHSNTSSTSGEDAGEERGP